MGSRIGRLRTEKGLSMRGLAAELGTFANLVWNWEHDRFKPSAKYMAKLCDYFNVSSDYLMFGR